MFKDIFKDTSVRILITFMVVLCVSASLVLPEWMQNNFLYGLSRGLAVLGLMLLWRTNLISFGHALYYGFGAYAVALSQKYFGITDIVLRFAIAVIAAGILGFMLGFILKKYREIFFAMLSLAFSMVLYGLLAKAEFLGSTDGMSISPSTLLGMELTREYLLFLIAFFVICRIVIYLLLLNCRLL
jgi:branched-chain amino acid transport system permease protein